MREEGQGDRSRSRSRVECQTTSDDMNLWDDPRIIKEAAYNAILLCAHASCEKHIDSTRALELFKPLSCVLAWCLVHSNIIKLSKEAEVGKEAR